MNKITIAVCDANEVYRNRFVSYLAEHKAGELQVHAFSGEDVFLGAARKYRFDVVILGSGFGKAEEVMRKEGIPLIVLTDAEVFCVAEDTGYHADTAGEEHTIPPAGGAVKAEYVFRYQPMDVILHAIWVAAGEMHAPEAGSAKGTAGIEVIGVYSPMRHEMQMPFSVVLAEQLAEREKVLYINLIGNAGFMELFHLTAERDLGDLVLCLRNGRLGAGTFRKNVYELFHLYYIPPFGNPENLHDFSLEDYRGLIRFLEGQTDFDTVVFDFGDGLEQFAKMLECCTSIYCPVKEGFFFDCQMNQFAAYLAKESDEELCDQLHRVSLPYSARRIHGGGDVLGQLLWSEFGDYVRNYLTGGTE